MFDYRGYTVYELSPNCQGLTTLEMLNILQGCDIAGLGYNSPEYIHLLVVAKKIAYNNRDHIITDPEFENIPVDKILSPEYAEYCRGMIGPARALEPDSYRSLIPGSVTVYVAEVDKDRSAISLISSIYGHFGSGVVVDGTGIVLQNR